jgi:hypothetical protein
MSFSRINHHEVIITSSPIEEFSFLGRVLMFPPQMTKRKFGGIYNSPIILRLHVRWDLNNPLICFELIIVIESNIPPDLELSGVCNNDK